MIKLDASPGNAGSLVLRSALAMSVMTGRAVRLTRIRSRRTSPGLKLQHLKIIDLLARLCNAHVEGAALGSQNLLFEPCLNTGLESISEISTPGSVNLLLQTIFLPLCLSGKISRLRLTGITHATRSPSFENLLWDWLPKLRMAGFRAEMKLMSAGFSPKGGGVVHATIHPVQSIEPMKYLQRGELVGITGSAVISGLDKAVAERQCLHLASRLKHLDVPVCIDSASVPAVVPGSYIILRASFEYDQQCFFRVGELGKSPETVANQVADTLLAFLESNAAADAHLANQLLLPMSFANGQSEIFSSEISEHMVTGAAVINAFLSGTIHIDGRIGEPGRLVINGNGMPQQDWQRCLPNQDPSELASTNIIGQEQFLGRPLGPCMAPTMPAL